ncbi:hypothetical protein PV325_008930 [Microctonus aethiopoides]|uniref:Uncharacterized protein n=1 Tax=Microctonus aethiopoides TaxID=144406 RepID=A0AA39FW64_9HYME|nr:hypothetical protein PV325_008930 [Microctonus aethiopoides]KAK0176977.1 hypothetical protein PV328_001074 [Microctonus aethiopoides]
MDVDHSGTSQSTDVNADKILSSQSTVLSSLISNQSTHSANFQDEIAGFKPISKTDVMTPNHCAAQDRANINGKLVPTSTPSGLIQQLLTQRELVYLPCRHHILEIVLRGVFEYYWSGTSGPKTPIFSRFLKN